MDAKKEVEHMLTVLTTQSLTYTLKKGEANPEKDIDISVPAQDLDRALTLFKKEGYTIVKEIDTFAYKSLGPKIIKFHFNPLHFNEPVRRKYLMPFLKFKKRPLYIVFAGADGAGKTTFSSRLVKEKNLRAKYVYMGYKTNVILPTKKIGKAMGRTPDKKKEKGMLDTVSNLAYLVEYFLRMVSRVYIDKLWNRYLVVTDRSAFDILSKRPELMKKKWFMRILHSPLYQPDLCFYLYTTPEVAQSRRKEFDLPATKERLERYATGYKNIQNKVEIETSQPMNEVYSIILKEVISRIQ